MDEDCPAQEGNDGEMHHESELTGTRYIQIRVEKEFNVYRTIHEPGGALDRREGLRLDTAGPKE